MKSPSIMIILAMVILSTASAISYSMTSSYGSFSVNTRADLTDSVTEWTMLSQEKLDHQISGGGELKEDHWAKNEKGEMVGVGVDINTSNHYEYSWSLIPGENEDLAARENLDVDQAHKIYAYAQANNTRGDNVKVDILVNDGSLKGYTNKAWTSNGELNAIQSGHVSVSPLIEKFIIQAVSIGLSENKTATRTSNYGTEYDFRSDATRGAEGKSSIANGLLRYFVDISNLNSYSIQKAIDAAEDGDSIQVNPGDYKENLFISKSLNIAGSDKDSTKIDGGEKGSVVYIPNKDSHVYLKKLDLFNGRAKYGGGVDNRGHLNMDSCSIYMNSANDDSWFFTKGYGGGVFNAGTLNMKEVDIVRNNAKEGGGVYNTGTFNMIGGCIYSNRATSYGGGVYNTGTFNMYDGEISLNRAKKGGGIYNYFAWVNLYGGSISRNNADSDGGIYDQYLSKKGVEGNLSIIHDNNGGDMEDHWYYWP